MNSNVGDEGHQREFNQSLWGNGTEGSMENGRMEECRRYICLNIPRNIKITLGGCRIFFLS